MAILVAIPDKRVDNAGIHMGFVSHHRMTIEQMLFWLIVLDGKPLLDRLR